MTLSGAPAYVDPCRAQNRQSFQIGAFKIGAHQLVLFTRAPNIEHVHHHREFAGLTIALFPSGAAEVARLETLDLAHHFEALEIGFAGFRRRWRG